jgi:hypothetical protein
MTESLDCYRLRENYWIWMADFVLYWSTNQINFFQHWAWHSVKSSKETSSKYSPFRGVVLYLIVMSLGPICNPEFPPRLSISIISINFFKYAKINFIPLPLALNVLQSLHDIFYKNAMRFKKSLERIRKKSQIFNFTF